MAGSDRPLATVRPTGLLEHHCAHLYENRRQRVRRFFYFCINRNTRRPCETAGVSGGWAGGRGSSKFPVCGARVL